MTFLEQTAQRIYENHGPSLDDVWVILPTRRAVVVFQQHLAAQSTTPFLAPHTLAVDDFITQAAGIQLIDPVSLLFELYHVFKEIDAQLSFEQFVGWAQVLLNDFDRVDQYLVDPHDLFTYVTAAKSIERWNLDLPPGAKAITETTFTTNYFKLFENLYVAYVALRERLLNQGLAYRGMAYRLLADNVETLVRDNPAYEKLYFVGFNALSRAEERIISPLLDRVDRHGVVDPVAKAEVYWDYDNYYLFDKGQEAGLFLRRYREAGWPGLKQDPDKNRLLTQPKTIRVVGVPTASLQAKVAGQLYADWGGPLAGKQNPYLEDMAAVYHPADLFDQPPVKPQRTAIVLADESLLVPVLYSLDTSVEHLNVTMGLSLRQSLLFTLIDALFEMQQTRAEFKAKDGREFKIPKFHHRQVVKVLNHPFVQQYARLKNLRSPPGEQGETRPLLGWIQEQIITRQKVYLEKKEMRAFAGKDPLLKTLFRRWNMDRPVSAIRVLYDLIDQLREVYKVQQDAIEIEYLYLFFSLLKQLETTLERQNQAVTVGSFRTFLNELIRQTSIPFTSEGNSALQVMGMLETRALDFDRVIILSANEGILPQGRRLNSLIPFDIALEKGLPTYREQESVMAYHLYRLLQRAREVVLVYTTSADAYGLSKGEQSRFIRQIEHELVPASRGKITLTRPALRFGAATQQPTVVELSVPKTDSIRRAIRAMLTDPRKGLFPTALNQFVSCSMRFYFSRIVRIKEEEEVEERLGVADFGNWLHHSLEAIDQQYRMRGLAVTDAAVHQVLAEKYVEVIRKEQDESGHNMLLYGMAQTMMTQFQRTQNEVPGLEVVSTEQELATVLAVEIDGEIWPVRIAGKIDRIERVGDELRIVDYKTGKVELPQKPPADLADKLASDPKLDKMRQLWLYKYLTLKNIQQSGGQLPRNRAKTDWYPAAGLSVTAGFYSFRKPGEGLLKNPVSFAGADESPAQYITDSEAILRTMIQAMLDPAQPFTKSDDLAGCQYCDFKKICGR
ncbi:MAG: PD-(D/E)XK nuclease family protein [Bacteroidetes bacterium]|nr:PD-(D/E)XK nuclease family protein [Fibrella sp.]